MTQKCTLPDAEELARRMQVADDERPLASFRDAVAAQLAAQSLTGTRVAQTVMRAVTEHTDGYGVEVKTAMLTEARFMLEACLVDAPIGVQREAVEHLVTSDLT